jgi:hypothetical protein
MRNFTMSRAGPWHPGRRSIHASQTTGLQVRLKLNSACFAITGRWSDPLDGTEELERFSASLPTAAENHSFGA